MTTTDTDTREDRLPRWAQSELCNLREEVARLKADATRTVGDTDTVVADVDDDIPLRPGARIRFTMPPITTPGGVTLRDPSWIEARAEGGRVEIRSGSSALLSIAPVGANCVQLSAVYR